MRQRFFLILVVLITCTYVLRDRWKKKSLTYAMLCLYLKLNPPSSSPFLFTPNPLQLSPFNQIFITCSWAFSAARNGNWKKQPAFQCVSGWDQLEYVNKMEGK